MKSSLLRNPVLRLARTALVTVACAYVGMAVLLYLRQDDLVFPGARMQGTAEAEVVVPEGAELLRLPVRGREGIAALWAPARAELAWRGTGRSRPTVLLFYGNGMCLAHSRSMIVRLQGLGADVLGAEYLGYGLSDGRPSEGGFYATADAAYDYLIERRKIDPRRLIVVGRSLGGAVALDLAARRPVGSVVTMSTFTGIADVAAPRFPLFPVRALLRHRFESIRKIRRVRCPVLLIHGTEDEVVPFPMRDRLATAAGGPVTRYDVSGAGHNNLFERDDEGVLNAIGAFVRKLR